MNAKHDFSEVTEAALKGKGLFDVLMTAQKAHLEQEYNQNRIKGADYSKVYLGGLESVLANTVQYLSATQLQEEQRQKLLAEVSLTKANEERLRLLLPLETKQLSLANEKAEYEIKYLLPLQREKFELEKQKFQFEIDRFVFERDNLWPLELEKFKLEKTLMEAQVLVANAEAALKKQQVVNLKEEAKLIPEQVKKIQAEIEALGYQNDLLVKQLDLIEEQIKKAVQEVIVMEQQVLKIMAEIALIEAKAKSEELNAGDDGLVANQIKLLKAQITGFIDDFNSKIFKTEADMWITSRSTNPEAVAATPVPSKPAKS